MRLNLVNNMQKPAYEAHNKERCDGSELPKNLNPET